MSDRTPTSTARAMADIEKELRRQWREELRTYIEKLQRNIVIPGFKEREGFKLGTEAIKKWASDDERI